MSILQIITQIVVSLIASAPALWLAGKWRVGGERARFTDAMWITALGVIVAVVIEMFLGSGLSIVQLFIYLYLVKKYYETDYVNAAIISVIAVAIQVVVGLILALVGVSLLGPSYMALVAPFL